MAKRPTDEEKIEEQKEIFGYFVKQGIEGATREIEEAEKMTDEEIRQMVLGKLEKIKEDMKGLNEKLIANGEEPIQSLAKFGVSFSGNAAIEPFEEHDYGSVVLTDESVEEVVALLVAKRDRLRAMPEEERTRRLEDYKQELIKHYAESMADDTDVIHTAYYRNMYEEEKAQAKTFLEKLKYFFGFQGDSLKSIATTLTVPYGAAVGTLYTVGLILNQATFNEFIELLPALAGFGALAYLPVTGGVLTLSAIANAIARKITRAQQDRDINKGLENLKELSEKSSEWKLIYDEVVKKLQEMNIAVDVAVERGL